VGEENFLSSWSEVSSLGLPLLGLGTALALSQLGTQQQQALRNEIEKVQLRIVETSERRRWKAPNFSTIRLYPFFQQLSFLGI
jgi:hypothetical protein